MLKLFQPKHRSLIGIDITSSAVKIIQLSREGEDFVVENYGREPLPPNAMDGEHIKDIDAVSQCIQKVISRLHNISNNAVLAVPDSAVIYKIIQINEGLNEQEMEEIIVSEAEKYIPYPVDEINLDFQILGPVQKNPNMLEVLIVASRSENVNHRVDVAVRAGLDVVAVDVVSFAVERVAQYLANDFLGAGQDKTIAIIDIGACYTHLFVLHGMKLAYSREEKFGNKQLIELIAEHYKMTYEQAAMAQDKGELPIDYESEILTPFKENILLQIKRTLQFYSANHDEEIDLILLAGGLARLPDLTLLVHEKLGINATIVNPISHMQPGKNVNLDELNNDAPALVIACGLALRNIE